MLHAYYDLGMAWKIKPCAQKGSKIIKLVLIKMLHEDSTVGILKMFFRLAFKQSYFCTLNPHKQYMF